MTSNRTPAPRRTDPRRLAQIAIAAGNWRDAADALGAAARDHPEDGALHYNLALACRLAGRAGEGAAAAKRAIALRPDDTKALFELAACTLETGEWATSADASRLYLSRHPGDADAATNLAAACLRLGLAEEAATVLEGVGGARAGLLRAEALRDAGAMEAFEAAMAALDGPTLRPQLLKLRAQGPRGRLPLDPARL